MHLSDFLNRLIQVTEQVQRNRRRGRYLVHARHPTTVRTVSLKHFLTRPRQYRTYLSKISPAFAAARLLKIHDPLGNCFTLISLPEAKFLKGFLQVQIVPTYVQPPHQRIFLAQHIANVCMVTASLIHQVLGGPVAWSHVPSRPCHALRQSKVHYILGFCPEPLVCLKSHPQLVLAA